MSDAVVTILEGKTDVACAVAAALVERIREVQSRGEEAQLALTGGSLGSLLWSAVVDLGDTDVDWSNVRVWWGDERWLPAGDPDRNDVQNDDAGLAALGLDPAKVHRVQGPDLVATPEDAAAAYGETGDPGVRQGRVGRRDLRGGPGWPCRLALPAPPRPADHRRDRGGGA